MSDPLKGGLLPDGKCLPEEEWDSEASDGSARLCSGDEIYRSIPPGNVRRLVEKFRRLGDQTFQSKPLNRPSCARKLPGSLSECRINRAISFRKKELHALRKKTDQLKKSRALDEKWFLLTPCLFRTGDFVSSSVSISQKAANCRNISRSFPSDGDRDRLGLAAPVSPLASDEPAVMNLCDQMEYIHVNALNASTNASSPSVIMDKDVAKCDEVYLDSTSKSFENQTVDNDSAVNDGVNDRPEFPAGFRPESETSILTSSTSSLELEKRLVGDMDIGDLNQCIENLSVVRTISRDKSEAEKTSDIAENLYENISGCLNYEKIEINPKLLVCRDQTCASPSTAVTSNCGSGRSRCDSIFTVSNNSVDSFDSDLTDYDIIYRSECLSSLPTQVNNVPSRHKQENIYQNVVPDVNSLSVNSFSHAVHAAGNVYWCLPEKSGLRNETRINTAGNKANARDFTAKTPASELSCRTSERLYADDENIYEECDFLSNTCIRIPDVSTCQEDGLDNVPSTDVCPASKDGDVSEDNYEKLTFSDGVICKDSNSSSIYQSMLGCSEIEDHESNAEEGKPALVFEPVNQLERIKAELVETEKKYIDRLWLLNGEFRMGLMSWNEENELLPADAFNQMFLNIDVIYKLHSVFFLPDLEACLNAEANKRIEDVFLKNADFLKLYAEYSCNFDSAMKTIEMWKLRIPEFKKIIEEIQQKPICHSLSLEHHMLEPIQRIPRYKLLLSKYLENLPNDSPEYEKAERALVKVTAAAEHCNKFLESLMKFQKVLDVQQRLWDKIELLTPSRELILSGRMKVTQQLENEEEKHLFLFSDTLLVCKKFPHGITPPYKLTLRLDVSDMQLIDRKKEGTAESFFLISRQGYLEMIPSSSEEREKWISALQTVLTNFAAQELSRRPGRNSGGFTRQKSISGRQAPIWIKDQFANRCMQCDESFNAIRRRHHCRACGIVVCGRCSNKQIPLEFDGFSQSHRVCDKCFCEIQNSVDPDCKERKVNGDRFVTSASTTQLMRSDGRNSIIHGHRQQSFFFFQTPGDKSQNHGLVNSEQKFPV